MCARRVRHFGTCELALVFSSAKNIIIASQQACAQSCLPLVPGIPREPLCSRQNRKLLAQSPTAKGDARGDVFQHVHLHVVV